MVDVRVMFEKIFALPPYEFDMERHGAESAWHGNYRWQHTQCAWDGFREASEVPTWK